MRITMMGVGQRYHLEPLARSIKRAKPDIWLAVNDLCEPQDDGTTLWLKDSLIFDKVYQSPRNLTTVGHPSGSQTEGVNADKPKPTEMAPWLLAFRVGWRLFKRRSPKRKISLHHEDLSKKSDLLHLQSIFVSNSLRWLVANPRYHYVVTIWGSDLLRKSSLEEYILQQRVLRYASAITVSTPEMQEVLLAKYGRELEPKLATTLFNPQVEPLLKYMRPDSDTRREDSERVFKICIGHNGMDGGNHERLLSGFSRISDAIKSRIELILPMTYGASPSYLSKVSAKANSLGCRVRVLSNFLDDDEVRRLRAETDILVFAPISDALSATVTQAFACGSAVVCGAWLSYRARARAGFSYKEIAHPEEAADAVVDLISNWSGEVPSLLRNKSLALSLFSEHAIGSQWVDLYNKVITNLSKN